MNPIRIFAVAGSFTAVAAWSSLAASAEKPEPPPSVDRRTVTTSEEAAPVYKPPLRGAPGGRVGGSTRSAGLPLFRVSVLAPDHTGLTVNEHPALFWHISDTATAPVEITLTDPRAIKPLLQYTLPAPVAAGVHKVQLGEHGIRLEPGIAYRWYIAVVTNAERRSKDILAGGAIERIEAPQPLRAALAAPGAANAASLLAEAGL